MKKNKRAKSTLPEAGCRLYCHCGRPAVLRDAKEVCRTRREGEKAYVCSGYPACDSFVLAHPNTLEPMGSLAGPELRRLRFEAHRQFGQLHKAGIMTKRQSYQWLAQIVHAPMSHAHIRHLGEYFCKKVIRESKDLLRRNQAPARGAYKNEGGVENVGADKAAKQISANNTPPQASLFTGKLVCADCGHPLVAARETQRRKNGTVKHYTSYFCSRFATTGHSICSWHRIFEISLKNLVLSEIRAHGKAVAADEAAVLDKLKQHIQSASAAQQEDCRQEISRLRRRLEELEQITAKLYEDKVSGAISGDSFSVLIQKNEQERIQKSERLDSLLAGERKAQQDIANIHQWAGTIRQYLDLQELNREIIEELIDRIEVGERTVIDGQRHQDIKIYYRFVGLV